MTTYNLGRFMDAQDRVYESVLDELRAGHKCGHWMWFVFPQIRGLGLGPTARRFAIESQAEAKAYSEHVLLGSRLKECTQIVLDVDGRSAEEIFHYPDVLKFRSCMTLFAQVTDSSLYPEALVKCFEGQPDQLTIDILRSQ